MAIVFNSAAKSSAYPMGYVKIYRDGVLRDQDSLKDYGITPKAGTHPLRVGTVDLASFFQGAVGKVALYDHELAGAQLLSHRNAM